MRITIHCLDCGFRLSVTLPAGDTAQTVRDSLSCGQCSCRRWSAV